MMLMRTYTPVWSKYRPAILKMMVDSESEPQSYRLSNHEFQALSTTKKSTFAFSLRVSAGKATEGLKDSPVAQDLWEILQVSKKASELIATSTFQFSMDRQFVFHVQKITE
jgi:hypothetical protein